MKVKIIQIIIVILLIFSAYFFGRLSMMNKLDLLNERIYELEIQFMQLEDGKMLDGY